MNYADAEESCATINSHLVYITSEQKQSALEPYLEGTGEFCKTFVLEVTARKQENDLDTGHLVAKHFMYIINNNNRTVFRHFNN